MCQQEMLTHSSGPNSQSDVENQVGDEDKLSHTPEYFQQMSLRLNTCKKQQASRDGRHQFWRQFSKVLYAAFDAVDRIASPQLRSTLIHAQQELNHWVSLDVAFFESLEGRDVNYRERIKTQLGVVCLAFSIQVI